MSKNMYRLMVLGCALIWLMVGMRLSTILLMTDAGRTPEPNDWFLLVLLMITGVLNVVALLQSPVSARRDGSGAPAA